MAKTPMVGLTCRIPAELAQALDARAAADGRDRSELVREALVTLLGAKGSLEARVAALESKFAAYSRATTLTKE